MEHYRIPHPQFPLGLELKPGIFGRPDIVSPVTEEHVWRPDPPTLTGHQRGELDWKKELGRMLRTEHPNQHELIEIADRGGAELARRLAVRAGLIDSHIRFLFCEDQFRPIVLWPPLTHQPFRPELLSAYQRATIYAAHWDLGPYAAAGLLDCNTCRICGREVAEYPYRVLCTVHQSTCKTKKWRHFCRNPRNNKAVRSVVRSSWDRTVHRMRRDFQEQMCPSQEV